MRTIPLNKLKNFRKRKIYIVHHCTHNVMRAFCHWRVENLLKGPAQAIV